MGRSRRSEGRLQRDDHRGARCQRAHVRGRAERGVPRRGPDARRRLRNRQGSCADGSRRWLRPVSHRHVAGPHPPARAAQLHHADADHARRPRPEARQPLLAAVRARQAEQRPLLLCDPRACLDPQRDRLWARRLPGRRGGDQRRSRLRVGRAACRPGGVPPLPLGHNRLVRRAPLQPRRHRAAQARGRGARRFGVRCRRAHGARLPRRRPRASRTGLPRIRPGGGAVMGSRTRMRRARLRAPASHPPGLSSHFWRCVRVCVKRATGIFQFTFRVLVLAISERARDTWYAGIGARGLDAQLAHWRTRGACPSRA
mmetsp:Transcript_15845/g.42975  ORF Transcript_15845/g.42975 Transcript_15845/m.42975 type:complete len:314 (+) Transcript_15845:370-1311(+)